MKQLVSSLEHVYTTMNVSSLLTFSICTIHTDFNSNSISTKENQKVNHWPKC